MSHFSCPLWPLDQCNWSCSDFLENVAHGKGPDVHLCQKAQDNGGTLSCRSIGMKRAHCASKWKPAWPAPCWGHKSLQWQERKVSKEQLQGMSQDKSHLGTKVTVWHTQWREVCLKPRVGAGRVWEGLSGWVSAGVDFSEMALFCGCCSLSHSLSLFFFFSSKRWSRWGGKSCLHMAGDHQEMASSDAEGDAPFSQYCSLYTQNPTMLGLRLWGFLNSSSSVFMS